MTSPDYPELLAELRQDLRRLVELDAAVAAFHEKLRADIARVINLLEELVS